MVPTIGRTSIRCASSSSSSSSSSTDKRRDISKGWFTLKRKNKQPRDKRGKTSRENSRSHVDGFYIVYHILSILYYIYTYIHKWETTAERIAVHTLMNCISYIIYSTLYIYTYIHNGETTAERIAVDKLMAYVLYNIYYLFYTIYHILSIL